MSKVTGNLKANLRKKLQYKMKKLYKIKVMKFNLMKEIIIVLFLFVCLVLLLKKKRMASGTIFSIPEA